MADKIWTQAINENELNIYIKYRDTFGKPKYQYIIFSIYMLLLNFIIIIIVLYVDSTEFNGIYIAQIIILIALLLTGIIPLIIIFKKLTSFLDQVKIRTELLLNLILSFIAIIVIAAQILLYIFINSNNLKENILLNGYNIVSIIISIIYICMCYVMTLYIILQPEARYNDTTSLSNYSTASSATPKSVASISSPNGTPNVISRISAFSQSPRTPSVSRTIVTRNNNKPQSAINNNNNNNNDNNTINTHLIRLKDIF